MVRWNICENQVVFCGHANHKYCYEAKKGSNVSFDSVKMILWHNHWWQKAPVSQRLVQGLQTNGVATAVEDTPLKGYTM